MKLAIISAILVIILGCATLQDTLPALKTADTPSGAGNLLPNEQGIRQLGMISNGNNCQTEEYETNSPLSQYSICNYIVDRLNDTQIVLELKKFTNSEDLMGTFQYESLHLRGFQGLISEDDYGDFSRFYVSNESTIYYYHLWIIKNEYLIHITSKGSKEAGSYIEKTGRLILSKFG